MWRSLFQLEHGGKIPCCAESEDKESPIHGWHIHYRCNAPHPCSALQRQQVQPEAMFTPSDGPVKAKHWHTLS